MSSDTPAAEQGAAPRRSVPASQRAPNQLAAVTVTYGPDVAVLASQQDLLPADCMCIVVDNASEPGLREQARLLTERRGGVFVGNAENLGLAAAANIGVRAAIERGFEFILLLDQDSEPAAGAVEVLFDGFCAIEGRDPSLGCVGPRLLDVDTGVDHGFHRMTRYRYTRVYPVDGEPIRVSGVNGSGLLMRSSLFEALGGLREDLFIDHVDTEWSFRIARSGYSMYGVPDALFRHRMGVAGKRYWLAGWRVWPYRSPLRHFYLFRNTIALVRSPDSPAVWRAWAPVKLCITFALHGLFDSRRGQQCREMLRGIRDGLAMPAGRQ